MFIDADALPRSEQFSSLYAASHRTIEAGPTRGQGRSLGMIRTTNNLRKHIKIQMSHGIERRAKGTTSMGVISCRSSEASLIPNYIPINATTECHWSNYRSSRRGRRKCLRVWEKCLRNVQRERDDSTTSTRLVIDPTTARKSRKRLEKN